MTVSHASEPVTSPVPENVAPPAEETQQPVSTGGLAAWCWTVILFAVFAMMAGAKYLTLHTTFLDLGLYLNRIFLVAEGQWQVALSGHAQPVLWLLALLHKVVTPDRVPLALLALQALLIALPLRWLWKEWGPLVAVAYALYFPIWYNNLFDFHPDHLVIPLLFAFFLLERKEKYTAACFAAVLLCGIKEPYALQTAACGLYLMLVRRQWKAGFCLMGVGLGYFIIALQFILPMYTLENRLGPNTQAFSWLGKDMLGVAETIFTNPSIWMDEIVNHSGKETYLLVVFGCLGFLSLLSPAPLIVALPIIFLALLSRNPNHFGLFFHYTSGLVAPMIVSFAGGITVAKKIGSWVDLKEQAFYILVIAGLLLGHARYAPSFLSWRFYQENDWSYHLSAYVPSQRDAAVRQALEEYIPKNGSVSVQNNINTAYLSQRSHIFVFPKGVDSPVDVRGTVSSSQPGFIWADFVVLDLTRPLYWGDKTCKWRLGACEDGEVSAKFLNLLEETLKNYEILYDRDRFLILRRTRYQESRKDLSPQFQAEI